MALRSIPVDQTRFVATQFVAAEARTDEDGNPRLGRNDRPVYRIAASVILSDGNGAVSAETIDVNVETGSDGVVPGDGLSMLDRVVFDNLTARPWSMDNGRSGVTLSATAVRAVTDSHATPGTPPTPAAESASEDTAIGGQRPIRPRATTGVSPATASTASTAKPITDRSAE